MQACHAACVPKVSFVVGTCFCPTCFHPGLTSPREHVNFFVRVSYAGASLAMTRRRRRIFARSSPALAISKSSRADLQGLQAARRTPLPATARPWRPSRWCRFSYLGLGNRVAPCRPGIFCTGHFLLGDRWAQPPKQSSACFRRRGPQAGPAGGCLMKG